MIHIYVLIQGMVLDSIHIQFFFISSFDCGKNFIIFGVGNSTMIHVNDKKYIFILGEEPKQELDNT